MGGPPQKLDPSFVLVICEPLRYESLGSQSAEKTEGCIGMSTNQ